MRGTRRIAVQRLGALFALALAGGALLAPAGQAATFTVASTTDAVGSCPTPATCSLRQALADADAVAGSDVVVFDLPAGSVISLTQGPLVVDPVSGGDALSISGPGAAALTVRRDPAAGPAQIFVLAGGRGVTLSGFTISGGLVGPFSGAAINAFTRLDLERMVIAGNTADAGGGGASGALVLGAPATIRGSTLHGNVVTNSGPDASGGAIVNAGELLVVNSTITDNHVTGAGPEDGGAILNFGPLSLVNSTVAGNSAEAGAGGIFGTSVALANSILAGNSAKPAPDCNGPLESQGHNIVGSPVGCTITATPGDQLGTAALALNPLLGPLAGNGGPTPTMALLAGSPARDAGSPATPTDVSPSQPPASVACRTADQRGVSRPAGARCDAGAFEVVAPPPVVPPPAPPAPPPAPPVAPPVAPPITPPPAFVAPPVDHFKCYDAVQRGFAPRAVRLRDQFATRARTARARRTTLLCNPVRKNDSPATQPAAHLVCYETRDAARFRARRVSVANQFGTSGLRATKPVSLCMPSLKRKGTRAPATSPDPQRRLDHFRCYAVDPKLTPRPVTLTDQFVKTRSTVVSVVRLCNPVSRNGGAVRRPTAHLVCYSIRDAAAAKTRIVAIRNQFGVARLRLSRARLLCLPSLKRDLAVARAARLPAVRSWAELR